MHGLRHARFKRRKLVRSARSILSQSTARDDAPNADKQNFFEGGPGDRAAFVPFRGTNRRDEREGRRDAEERRLVL